MINEEYLQTQQSILLIAAVVSSLPLNEFISQADRADTIAPLLDPTLWQKAHTNLEALLRLARALEAFQGVVLWEKEHGH